MTLDCPSPGALQLEEGVNRTESQSYSDSRNGLALSVVVEQYGFKRFVRSPVSEDKDYFQL